MKITLRVTYNDGSAVDAEATTADLVAFEEQYDRSVVHLDTELRLRDLCWLAWRSLSRQTKTAADFHAWLDAVDGVELTDSQAAPVPLESTASTSA